MTDRPFTDHSRYLLDRGWTITEQRSGFSRSIIWTHPSHSRPKRRGIRADMFTTAEAMEIERNQVKNER